MLNLWDNLNAISHFSTVYEMIYISYFKTKCWYVNNVDNTNITTQL